MAILYGKKLRVFSELWLFARAHKRFMFSQVLFILIVTGMFLFFAHGTVVAPFIYTIF